MQNRNFYIFAPIKETNMRTKVLFLAIPDKEFSKIITEQEYAYILTLIDRYRWNHRKNYKFTVPLTFPEELIKLLSQAEIQHFYTEMPINL